MWDFICDLFFEFFWIFMVCFDCSVFNEYKREMEIILDEKEIEDLDYELISSE